MHAGTALAWAPLALVTVLLGERAALAQSGPNNPAGQLVVFLANSGEGNLVSYEIQGNTFLSGSATYGDRLLTFCDLSPGAGYVVLLSSGACSYAAQFTIVSREPTFLDLQGGDGHGNACSLPGPLPSVSYPPNLSDPGWQAIVDSCGATGDGGPSNADAAVEDAADAVDALDAADGAMDGSASSGVGSGSSGSSGSSVPAPAPATGALWPYLLGLVLAVSGAWTARRISA